MTTPDKKGIYLCKVRGLRFTDLMLLSWDGEQWWQYVIVWPHIGEVTEGWCAKEERITIEDYEPRKGFKCKEYDRTTIQ